MLTLLSIRRLGFGRDSTRQSFDHPTVGVVVGEADSAKRNFATYALLVVLTLPIHRASVCRIEGEATCARNARSC